MDSLIEMLKECNTLSLTRFISVISWVVWIIVTIYLVLTNHSWGNYGEFTAAAGTAAFGQLVNKFINSKYNTKPGEVGKIISKEG